LTPHPTQNAETRNDLSFKRGPLRSGFHWKTLTPGKGTLWVKAFNLREERSSELAAEKVPGSQ